MVCQLADELVAQVPGHKLTCAVAPIELHADVAIPLGLMLTEIITNANKYAYGDAGGPILVDVRREDGRLILSVTDHGRGVPAGFRFDGNSQATLGRRRIASTARQLSGTLEVRDAQPGTMVVFSMPDPADQPV